jgi:hypothetical protein
MRVDVNNLDTYNVAERSVRPSPSSSCKQACVSSLQFSATSGQTNVAAAH